MLQALQKEKKRELRGRRLHVLGAKGLKAFISYFTAGDDL
jgi:hypothetical protein